MVKPVKPKLCAEKPGCSDMDSCNRPAVSRGKCGRRDQCKSSAVIGHVVDPSAGAAEGVFCNEHGRRAGT